MRRVKVMLLGLCMGLIGSTEGADLWSAHSHTAFLPADQAFRVIGAEQGPEGIRVQWDIAPGYYLYRDRLNIKSQDGRSVTLKLPQAEPYQDAVLGKTGIYRLQLNAIVKPLPKAPELQQLVLHYQGCADQGLCYPPQQTNIAVTQPSH